MSSDQMPAPGKTKLIKFPPSRAVKDVKCPGYARGGCLSFDLTGTLRNEIAKRKKTINKQNNIKVKETTRVKNLRFKSF